LDTSSKYIKMCEKADRYIFPNGCNLINEDFLYCEKTTRKLKPGWIILYKYRLEGYLDTHDMILNYFIIWKQDQLQKMLNYPLWKLVWDFEEFTEKMTNKDYFENKTMEQLWLAFVMKEKYNKIWDEEKEEWINARI